MYDLFIQQKIPQWGAVLSKMSADKSCGTLEGCHEILCGYYGLVGHLVDKKKKDEAQADLDGIKSYIAKNLENPSAAISTVRNITKDLRRLRAHSLIGASLSSIADVESDYRFLVTGSYLTFYRVLDNDVYVDRVLYGRRDYLRILFGDVQDDETNE